MAIHESLSVDDLMVLKPGRMVGSTDVIPLKDFKDENLVIDLTKGSWSYLIWKDLAIGESCIYENFKDTPDFGVIGVYNRKDLMHISGMLQAANSFHGFDIKYL